jgi:ATP-dependent DNA helicase RecG
MEDLPDILTSLEHCIRTRTYESLETDWLEVKPVPAHGKDWTSIHESICAFLNSNGGVVLLGVKEVNKAPRHWAFTGYTENQSSQLSDLRRKFQDSKGHLLESVGDHLRVEVKPFMDGQIAILIVAPLPADQKYCFINGTAYERFADQDQKVPARRIEAQEERKREMETCRELKVEAGLTLQDLSLQRINEFVTLINTGQTQPIETTKPTLEAAEPFLARKRLISTAGEATTLGLLVAAAHPADHLSFRCHLDCFVEDQDLVVAEKKVFRDNILQLMEQGHSWVLRNIQTAVSPHNGGRIVPEYPAKLIRECINNALAHRDYSINRPVQITIKPKTSISIRNPGRLPAEMIVESNSSPALRRVFPDPSARNPKLAEYLKFHSKWEGKGIGMAELVNYALANQIGLPHYIFHSAAEISLVIPSGKLLDESTDCWLELLDGLILKKTAGRKLSPEHKIVLAYLLKSEKANLEGKYTLALTQGNNHLKVLRDLLQWELIQRSPHSERYHEIFIVHEAISRVDYHAELIELFGGLYQGMDSLGQEILRLLFVADLYAPTGLLESAQLARLLRAQELGQWDGPATDNSKHRLQLVLEKLSPGSAALNPDEWFNELHATGDKPLGIAGSPRSPSFRINRNYQKPIL